MRRVYSHPAFVLVVGLVVTVAPLTGAWLAQRELRRVFEFPPRLAIPSGYTTFSWWMAGSVAALLVVTFLPWGRAVRRGFSTLASASHDPRRARARYPSWAIAAWICTLAWWMLAWTRWSWFEPLQRYTFFPLWLSFIVALNGAVQARTGTCLMLRSPGRWFALFAVSALCWWVFEWLNRFVANWHYLAVSDFSAVPYAIHATACFSTVLPAIAAVAEWLSSHPTWSHIVANGPRWHLLERKPVGVALVAGGACALFATGAAPTWCYPALWLAPLALYLGASALARSGLSREMVAGDWSRAATWMAAALVCGFFWELWNWRSAAKWIYTVPGAERWYLFEMPLLGYAGYLPFGLECLFVAERVLESHRTSARRA